MEEVLTRSFATHIVASSWVIDLVSIEVFLWLLMNVKFVTFIYRLDTNKNTRITGVFCLFKIFVSTTDIRIIKK